MHLFDFYVKIQVPIGAFIKTYVSIRYLLKKKKKSSCINLTITLEFEY